MLKIAITGSNGKMGKMIQSAVNDNTLTTVNTLINQGDNLDSLPSDFDVLIDFTRPEATFNYLEFCAKNNNKMVIGTTGFNDDELKFN